MDISKIVISNKKIDNWLQNIKYYFHKAKFKPKWQLQ